jgi:hypothetical protein
VRRVPGNGHPYPISALSLQHTNRFRLPGAPRGILWLLVAVVRKCSIRAFSKQHPNCIDMPGECCAVKRGIPLRNRLDIHFCPRSNQYLADRCMTLHGGGVQRREVVVPSGTWVGVDWGCKQEPNSLDVARRGCQMQRSKFGWITVHSNQQRTVQRHQLFEDCGVAGRGRVPNRFVNLDRHDGIFFWTVAVCFSL